MERISPSKYEKSVYFFGFLYTDAENRQGIREDIKMILDLVTLLHHKLNLSF